MPFNIYWGLNYHTKKCQVSCTRYFSSKNIWLAQYSITRAETCFLNWEQEQWVVSRMILEDYIQTPPVLWGVGKRTPYQTSWHVCHYYLNTKVLKWAAAIFVMKIYFLNIFNNKNKSPNYINSCCRLEMKSWANQCHLLFPYIVVIHVLQ